MIQIFQKDTVLAAIEYNSITVKRINEMLHYNGYYSEIAQKKHEFKSLYELRKTVELDNIYNATMREFFPRVLLGRQTGHTTAIVEFAKKFPDLKIGLMTPSKIQFDEFIRKHGDRPKNVYWFRRNNENDALRGLRLDYIIIDCYGSIGLSQSDFKNLIPFSDLKIMGVGN